MEVGIIVARDFTSAQNLGRFTLTGIGHWPEVLSWNKRLGQF